MQKPLVSVIIPTYNCAKYISRAIASVRIQKWPVEVIVVDDGSTDGTESPFVSFGIAGKYIKQENQGPAVARNTGISAATGEYIAFLDADDEWLPGRLERTVAPMIQNPSLGMAYCNAVTRHMDGSESPRGQDCEKYRIKGAIYPPPRICTPAVTMRRSLLKTLGGFCEELPFFEDRDLWIRASEISSTRELTVSLVRIYERADSMRHQPIDIKDKINTRLVVARRTIERNLDAQGPWWKPAFPTMAAAWLSAGIQCIQDGYKYRAFVCLIKSFTTHPNCHAVRFMLRAVIPNGIIATIKKYAQRAKERDALLASAKRDTTRKPS